MSAVIKKVFLGIICLVVYFTIASVLGHIVNAQVISPTGTSVPTITPTPNPADCIRVNEHELGFKIPSLGQILTFVIRMFFVIAGLIAFVMALLGIIGWITSRGEKEAVGKAQQTIQAAFLGVLLIAIILALIVTLEQVIFKGTICLGLSCPISIPGLLVPAPNAKPNPCIGPTPTPVPGSGSLTPGGSSGNSGGSGSGGSSSNGTNNGNGNSGSITPNTSTHPYNPNSLTPLPSGRNPVPTISSRPPILPGTGLH